jgi:exodeoxyribonuclease V gamma subunit
MLGAPPDGAGACSRPEGSDLGDRGRACRAIGPRRASRRWIASWSTTTTAIALALAGRVADLFDQYAVFRPEMVRTWEKGGGDPADWQPALWRALVARLGALHTAARARDLLAALPRRPRAGGAAAAARAASSGSRPCRRSTSTCSPRSIRHLELHLFALSPSRGYLATCRRRANGAAPSPPERTRPRCISTFPPLLASLGRVGRDFQQVLESRVEYEEDPADRYREPGDASLLATLQSDVLDLRLRGPAASRLVRWRRTTRRSRCMRATTDARDGGSCTIA